MLLVTMAFSKAREERCSVNFGSSSRVCTYGGDGVRDVEAWKKEMGKTEQYHEIEVS